MSGLEIAGATALVTGASRGFGRGIATALSQAGAQVTGVARDPGPLEELRAGLGGSFTAVAADAADPLSGGYAGAKAAIRWLTAYAAQESARAGFGIRFVSLLPQLTPATELGAVFAAAYGTQGPTLTPERVGQAVIELVTGTDPGPDAYLLTAAGLSPL
jgi:NAD(P)-dependent dehydrogenase (short-subunit alcohol dehydrogenase family)